MASLFDELDRGHIVQMHRKIELLIKMVARQQSQIHRLTKQADAKAEGRAYLRNTLWEQRKTVAEQKMYIRQLENELKLRGLE